MLVCTRYIWYLFFQFACALYKYSSGRQTLYVLINENNIKIECERNGKRHRRIKAVYCCDNGSKRPVIAEEEESKIGKPFFFFTRCYVLPNVTKPNLISIK